LDRTLKFAHAKRWAPVVGIVPAAVMPSPCECSARF
jgi:hypothetical protein